MSFRRAWLAFPTAMLVCLETGAGAEVPSHVHVPVGNQIFGSQNAGQPWSLTLKGDPPCLYRFEVRGGDRWEGETQTVSVDRSELSGPIDSTNPAMSNGHVWTAYQFKLEQGHVLAPGWVVLGDWHAQRDPGDTPSMFSPWQLELRRGDILDFNMHTSAARSITSVEPFHFLWKSSAPIQRGVWHSIASVAQFDWRPKGEGGVTVWLDGAKIVDYKGPFGYNQKRPPYFKFGIYRSAAPETLVVDYANVETSRSSLASRIHAPPPICEAMQDSKL